MFLPDVEFSDPDPKFSALAPLVACGQLFSPSGIKAELDSGY